MQIQSYQTSCLPEDRAYCKSLSLKECQKLQRMSEATKKTAQQRSSKGQDVHHLHDQNQDDSSVSSVEEYLHSVFQLGNSSHKFIVTVAINGVNLDMHGG